MTVRDVLSANLARVRTRMREACRRAGRDEASVRLLAVTKSAELDSVRTLVELGVRSLGENRPQQLAQRAAALRTSESPDAVEWHLIGHLQRNKVELVLPVTMLIHSADSVRLLTRISEVATRQNRTMRVLLEANVSGEASKDGFDPAVLRGAWDELLELPGLELCGLMTMAPQADAESARTVFRALRLLRDELVLASNGRASLPELSMGMSGDFEVAIEEGATIVRIGSSLFEGLG